MKLPYWVLANDLQQRGIRVDYKDLNYEVLDSETSSKFIKAIREYDDLLTKFSKTYEPDTWDCLLPDTPIIYKDPVTGTVDIAEIQELPPDGGFYVLDMNIDDGSEELTWTRVNWVRSKRSCKRIITISAPEGFIQVTEDHRFWIRQRWCRIGKFVHVDEGRSKGEVGLKVAPIEKVFSDSYELDPDLAWVYGLFLAEGNATVEDSRRKCAYSFHIDMADESTLLKAKDILEQHFNLRFLVEVPPSQRAGTVRGGCVAKKDLFRLQPKGNEYGAVKPLAIRFRKMFYTLGGKKKVPLEVLNATLKAKAKFLDGFLIGDAFTKDEQSPYRPEQTINRTRAEQKSRVALLGIEVILRKLGIKHRYYYRRKESGRDYFALEIREGTKYSPRQKLYHVDKNYDGTLVYDMNTESGHFIASTFLVHNCDNYAILFKAVSELVGFTCAYAEGNLYLNRELVGRHAFNLIPWMVGTNLTWLVVEPQLVGVYGYQWFSTLGTYNRNGAILGLYVYVVDYVWL
jgi:hypothetical protein